MQTLWKQNQELHPLFAKINCCLQDDWFLLPFELSLQRAHAQVLLAARILSVEEHEALQGGLDRISKQYANQPCPDSDAEDLHTWTEMKLTDLAGEAGKKIHTARSRNDQVATLLKMYVISAGGLVSGDLSRMIKVICGRAKEWSDLIFPLQTHCQFAAPGSVGFWILRYGTSFDHIRRHLRFLISHWRRFCPLGSGAVAGSSIPIDRQLQAKLLGFDAPSLNALESTTTRDECLEFLAIAAQAALHLQSLATDIIGFSQTSLGWVEYPIEFSTGSSMMPNKANPDAMELLRGECNEILAAHGQAFLLLKGLPSGYNRDLQCIKPIVHNVVDRLRQMCELATAFVTRLDFDADRLRASLAHGSIEATLRMERLVKKGSSLRDAHHDVAHELQQEGGDAVVPALANSGRYQTIGGANPAETRRVAELLLKELRSDP